MPNANDIEFVRALVRPVGETLAQDTIRTNQPLEVVAEVEAGTALFNAGGAYRIISVVKDENTGAVAATPSVTGTFGDANWSVPSPPNGIRLHPTLPAQGPSKKDHIYEATVVLVAGKKDTNVEFTDDILFVISE